MGCSGSSEAKKPKRKGKGAAPGPVRSAGPPQLEDATTEALDFGWIKIADDKTLAEVKYAADELKAFLKDDNLESLSENLFQTHDEDESGFIDRVELKGMILAFAERMDLEIEISDDLVDKHFKDLDANEDDKLSLEEFSKFVREVYERLNDATSKFIYDRKLELSLIHI